MRSKKDIEKTDVRKKYERRRYLNIIYFVDSNRTRTLKFSIEASYVTVGLISGAVLWSVIASALLVRDRFVISEMQDHARSLLGLVFNYQTRYDEVYEKAYPASDSPLLANDPTEAKANDLTLLPSDEAEAIRTPDQAGAVNPKAKVVSNAPLSKEPPISIDNLSTRISDRNLVIRLSLMNLNSPHKTSGSVHAVAQFVDQHQQTHTLGSHPTPSGDGVGDPEHFNIRYFKNKVFYFVPPKDTTGHFKEVLITVKDNEGRSKDFHYPLNGDVTAQDVTIPPAPKTSAMDKASDSTLDVEQPQ